MRIHRFLLLAALLALEIQVPAVSGRRKGGINCALMTKCRVHSKCSTRTIQRKWTIQRSELEVKRPVCPDKQESGPAEPGPAQGLPVWPERFGGCPPDDKPCLSVPDQCTGDSQCPSGKKCCSQACFRQCVPRVLVKPGSCPKDQLRCLSPVQHLCSRDLDCPRRKRCCPGACGRDCRNPVRG